MSLRSRPLLSAILASAMAGSLLAIFMAYLGIHLDSFGTIALIIGIVFFSRNFFQIFLRVPFGELAQIIGRKPLITAGTGFYTLAYLLMYFAHSWVLIFLATFLVAIGMSLYWPAMFSYIGDISTDDYGKVNGYIFQGSDIGVILGTFTASHLLRNNIVDLNGLFGLGFLAGVIGTIVIHFTLVESLGEGEKQHVDSIIGAMISSFKESVRNLVEMTKTRPLGKIYGFQVVVAFNEYFFNSFFPLIVVLSMGFNKSVVSDIIFTATLVIFFFKPYLGSISDRFGFRGPVLISLTIAATCLVVLTKISNFVVVIAIYALLVSASLTAYLAINGATSNSARPSQRGMAMGALGFWVSAGRSSSSLILTPVWSWYVFTTGNKATAIRNVFLVTAAIILSMVVILSYYSRNMKLEYEPLLAKEIQNV